MDQYGDRYTGDTFVNGMPADNGDPNLVFNSRLRDVAASYMKDIFSTFGTNF